MIDRAVEHPEYDYERFDWFNDATDTLEWLFSYGSVKAQKRFASAAASEAIGRVVDRAIGP